VLTQSMHVARGVPVVPATDYANTELENDLKALAAMPIAHLRARWRASFRTEPPPSFGPDLLRRRIAYFVQEQAYGGLSLSTKRELDRLIKIAAKSKTGRIQLPRRIKAGSVLIREWKGKSHRVTVMDEGYVYDDKKYETLSEIARLITGTRWNGPRFFGLRKQTNEVPSKRSLASRERCAES